MGIMAQQSFIYQGKEQTVWTEEQLGSMGKAAIKQRAMDLRDLVGTTMQLPPMPRHQDLLPGWIISVQVAMMRGQTGSQRPVSRASEAPARKQVHRGEEDDQAEAFFANKMAREAAQQRNRGSNIFGGA